MNWFRRSRRFVSIIGSANEEAGPRVGYAKAPEVLLNSGFLDNVHVPLRWDRILKESEICKDESDLRQCVIAYSKRLSKFTKKAVMQKRDVLVLGGNHSCALGTWSGAASAVRDRGTLGLIWVDAHLDSHIIRFNSGQNLHETPIMNLLGFGDSTLCNLDDFCPKIHPQNLVIVGAQSFKEEEYDLFKKLNVRILYMNNIKQRGCLSALTEAVEIATRGTCGFGLSINMNTFNPVHCPAVNIPKESQIDATEFLQTLKKLNLDRMVAAEIAEFSPDHDSEDKLTEKFIFKLIEAIYSRYF